MPQRPTPLGRPEQRHIGRIPPIPGAHGPRAPDHQHGQPRNRGHLRDPPHQQDHRRGNNEQQDPPHPPRNVENPRNTSVEGTVATMRLRSRLQDLKDVLDLYGRFEPSDRDGRDGLIKWHNHLYDYLQAIYKAISSVENTLRIVKDYRTTKWATEKTAEEIVAFWTEWKTGNKSPAFEKEQMETYRARRSQGRGRSLKDRRAILDYYFLSNLRFYLDKDDRWRGPADDDVKNAQERLIAWTGAQRNG